VDALPGYRNGLEEASQAEHAPGDGDVAASPGEGVGGALCEPDPAAICPEDQGGGGAVAGAVAEGDFDLALRGLLGEEAPLSAQVGGPASRSIGRRAEEAWQRRRLDDLEPVYLCADGVYVRAGLEMEKAVVLVVIVGCVNGGKVVVSVERSDRATAVIWKMLMVAERRFRRLNAPHLLAKVYAGVRYVDGVEATQEVAA
jgi:hypothetical protein